MRFSFPFGRTQSATLVGTELVTVIEGLDHSVRLLAEEPQTPATTSAIARRTALANRLRRAIIS